MSGLIDIFKEPANYLGIIAFITLISVLVAAHELGHYLFARLFRMGVEEFAIGFGKKPLFTWMKKTYPVDPPSRRVLPPEGHEGTPPALEEKIEKAEHGELTETTVFTVRPWPIGGFVRIKGMVPHDDGSEIHIPGGFYSKPPWQRFIVLLAGPVFSLLAGIILIGGLYMSWGRELLAPVLGAVAKDGAAYHAGLLPGDRVMSVDGQPVREWQEMVVLVRDRAGQPLEFVVQREGSTFTKTIAPKLDPEPTPVLGEMNQPTGEMRRQGKIGAAPDPEAIFREVLPLGAAVREASLWPVRIVQNLFGLIAKPSRFKDEVGGPITILAASKRSAEMGLPYFVQLAGLLSISLGIFNLLPIFPLDGGQMMVSLVEMLRRGRRLSMQVQGTVATVGFAMVLMLIVSVFWVDINRFWGRNQQGQVQQGSQVEFITKEDVGKE
jgi:regulator of sigma E protease